MIRHLKNWLRSFIYIAINFLVRPQARISEKSLLLVRVDFIGDYVLFRNFLEALRCDPRYRGYHFTFLGNASYKNLFEKLDAKFFEHALWLDPARFNQDFGYRFKMLRMITRRGYEVVISPVYSRGFWGVDHIVHLVKAREKIGSEGDLTNISKRHKKISDAYYTKLVPATKEILFEFQRNREFFQGLLGKTIAVDRPRINLAPSEAGFNLFDNYALFFIGGSSPAKKWRIANYIQVGRYLADVHGLGAVFCGGPDDRADLAAAPIDQETRFMDLVGRTTLWELASVMVKARLLLSNDTMAPHLASALGLDKLFVVSRGDLYGRCLPYPPEISRRVHVIGHPEITRDPQAFRVAANSYGYVNRLDINRITPEIVIERIDKALRRRENVAARQCRVA